MPLNGLQKGDSVMGITVVEETKDASNVPVADSVEAQPLSFSYSSSSPASSIRPITPPDGVELAPPVGQKDIAQTDHASRFALRKDKCIDDLRPFKVVVVGAGFSGITTAIRQVR